MLVDISRRPVRLIMDECPTVIVVRTMGVRGKVDGLIHHDEEHRGRLKSTLIQPTTTVPNGDSSFIETILEPTESREIYTVSGYNDQVTRRRGSWRINFIMDEVKGGGRMLTLMDETNSAMLFTVQIPVEVLRKEKVYNTPTPLQRLLHKQTSDGAVGLWGAVMGDEF